MLLELEEWVWSAEQVARTSQPGGSQALLFWIQVLFSADSTVETILLLPVKLHNAFLVATG